MYGKLECERRFDGAPREVCQWDWNIPAWRGASVTTYRRRELWERLPNKTDSAFTDSTRAQRQVMC